jgi:TIR domain
MRSFSRRPYHYFISYSHRDISFATDLKKWLSDTAGLQIWFDQQDLRSGERVQADLATSISRCQGIIFLLSKNSLESKYVPDEMDQALAEKKEHPHFQIVLLRLDDCDIAGQWKSVRQLKWHDLATPSGGSGTPAGPILGLRAAAEILCRTHAYDGWQRRQSELKEIYVSRGWRDGDEVFADEICRYLAVHGLRLVGDLPDRGTTDPQRIAGIMQHCWGHVLVLPRRTSDLGPEAAYKYFVLEKDLSSKLGLPRTLFTEPDCALPASFVDEAVIVSPAQLGGTASTAPDALQGAIYDFVENLIKPRSELHAFFASEYRANDERNSLARAVIESTGTLPCYWGKDYRDMNIQGCIRDAIAAAKFVVADLTSDDPMPPESPARSTSGGSRVNVNACIEAAVAWGANVRVLLLAAENPQTAQGPQEGRTKHVPFMLRNARLDIYGDSVFSLAPGVEFLGAVHRAVLDDRKRFGRRVINYELGL